MTGLAGEFTKRPEKRFLRTVARIEPQFRGSGGRVDLFILHMITRTPERAVPLLRQRLPVQIVRRSRAFDGCGRPRAVLMHDDATQRLYAVGNPQLVGDRYQQFVCSGRGGIINLQILTRSVRSTREADQAKGECQGGFES